MLENPVVSVAWVFDKILAELLQKEDGKFACGDQCRYGLRDSASGKLIRKRAGWLTNCEPLLNKLGKQCRCPPGVHEVLLGNNASGPRAAQAAFYPKELCRNICQGVVESMCLDYAIAMSCGGSAAGDGVYAVDDDDMLLEDVEGINDLAGEEDFEEPFEVEWRFGAEGQLIRVHRVPRRKLFVPLSSTAPPLGHPGNEADENAALGGRLAHGDVEPKNQSNGYVVDGRDRVPSTKFRRSLGGGSTHSRGRSTRKRGTTNVVSGPL